MSDGKVIFDITGNLSGINSALNNATNAISRQTAKWTVLGQTAMNALTSAGRVAFNAVKDLAINAFEYNAQMETYEVNFKTLLGSTEAAQVKMAELREYAAKTPFAFTDLAEATQTMLAFGMTSDESALALRHLGDISLGDSNKLKSLTLAFSQVSSAGKLAGQDLLQMINAGFNPLQVIAEKTGASYADLKAVMSGEKTSEDFQLRMEAARKEVEELGINASESAIMLTKIGEDGMISADMVAAAMRIATSEGGAFYKALESASETAKGQISTIQDSWDMLAGKVTGGAFDKLSQEVFPKVISWLDELNAAYDENGFDGLKDAAGGIFGELGELALNTGSSLIAQLYNGITGDAKTGDEIKGYLSEIFGVASDAVDNIKNAGVGFLEWIKENGDLVGAAATTIGIGLGIFALLSNPLVGILTSLAAALLIFTTDWETFEAKYPNIVAAFEGLTGIEFSDFVSGVENAKSKLSTFYNEALVPLFDWLSEHGEAIQIALAGIAVAMILLGSPVAGFSLLLGVIITNWNDIKAAVDNAFTSVNTFFTQTIPAGWNQFVADVKKAWQENICDPIDKAALAVADFLGIQVPADWSLTDAIGKAWDDLVAKINSAIDLIANFFGIERTLLIGTDGKTYAEELTKQQEAEAAQQAPARHHGKYAALDEDTQDELLNYAYMAIQKGTQNGLISQYNWDFSEQFLASGMFQQFQADLSDAMNDTSLSIEHIEAWFEDPQTQLQSQLNGTDLSVNVHANLSLSGLSDGLQTFGPSLPGLTGKSHAAGGIFPGTTRFLHTAGESGAEALLPLDTLWRKMGLIFDQTFAANLDGLQYSVMPALPAADPQPRMEAADMDRLADRIVSAISGLTVEMDKKTVGRILKPVVSREMEQDVKARRWTS